jgi:thiamine biosynthesis lipoprotein
MITRYPYRYAVDVMGTVFSFCLAAPVDRAVPAVSAAVAELRAVDAAFSPYRTDSMVTRVRRGELAPSAYPPCLTEVVGRCAAMNLATDGWFDAWGLPAGFDPSGLVKGWATERAAAHLLAAGIANFAINGGGDVLVRGLAPHGGPWRVGIRDPHDKAAVVLILDLTDAAVATSASYERGPHVVAPPTGSPVATLASATVVGPDLAAADAYATALYAAGPPGLAWFDEASDYCAFTLDERLVATFSDGVPQHWLPDARSDRATGPPAASREHRK